MRDADIEIDQLSTEQILYVLDHCFFKVPRPAPPPNEGRIGGLAGPACLGAADGAHFYVNVETGEVGCNTSNPYDGTLLQVIMKVRGSSESEARDFIRRKAVRAEWDVSYEDDADEKS